MRVARGSASWLSPGHLILQMRTLRLRAERLLLAPRDSAAGRLTLTPALLLCLRPPGCTGTLPGGDRGGDTRCLASPASGNPQCGPRGSKTLERGCLPRRPDPLLALQSLHNMLSMKYCRSSRINITDVQPGLVVLNWVRGSGANTPRHRIFAAHVLLQICYTPGGWERFREHLLVGPRSV